ncbi:hypothetical protein ACIQPS_36405 [Streptomyces sp. NPDC091290]|uniref:hypothetical protein n=1 Tax=Streptomyces sp. NPDC091290 TaxID=3365990 RepID=UPI0037F5AC55
MTESGVVGLMHLEDPDGDRRIVRVVGRYEHSVLPSPNVLEAEVLAPASFVVARPEFYLSSGTSAPGRRI